MLLFSLLFPLLERWLQASGFVAGWHLVLKATPAWARVVLPELLDTIHAFTQLVEGLVLRHGP